jgi:hypothetical protein
MKRVVTTVLTALAFSLPAHGEVLEVRYFGGETMDLTRVGTIDWCVFRPDDPSKPTYSAADWKDGGAGITREIRIRGNIEKSEITRFTGVGWGWTDGTPATLRSFRPPPSHSSHGWRVHFGRRSSAICSMPPARANTVQVWNSCSGSRKTSGYLGGLGNRTLASCTCLACWHRD